MRATEYTWHVEAAGGVSDGVNASTAPGASAALIACADADERAAYGNWLRSMGWTVTPASSSSEAIAKCRQGAFALAIADLASPQVDGLELTRFVRETDPGAAVLLVARPEDPARLTVAAVKAGAGDLLLRPARRDDLLEAVRGLCAAFAPPQTAGPPDERRRPSGVPHVVARSPQMLEVIALAARVAHRDTPVLILGESGTGKDVLARTIHATSRRAERPLISVNCAAIPESLLESELFGYRRGAFTGASGDKPGLLGAADGGTLFLDEVGELPLTAQAKLLRCLEDQRYFPLGSVQPRRADFRLIAVTNARLQERVKDGSFRGDLYYRLSVFSLHVPPLRDRREDILALAQHFLDELRREVGKSVPGLSKEAAAYLTSRTWPGNARELKNAIERAVIVSDGNLLTSADFCTLEPRPEEGSTVREDGWTLPEGGVDLRQVDRTLIAAALVRSGYNKSAAARLLGLSRPALRYRAKKYGLSS
jgi:DNA-binding NtrC family response regulator